MRHGDWLKYSGCDWASLLCDCPQYVSQCSEYGGWARLNGFYWCRLLSFQPALACYCSRYNGWAKMCHGDILELISERSDLSKYFN